MKLFGKKEKRSEKTYDEQSLEGALLTALIGTGVMTKEKALQIPSVSASVGLIQGIISSLPIRLYEKTEDGLKEIVDDDRVYLLNDDTRGNLTGTQLMKAIVEDYLLTKGAYVYIEKSGTKYKSLRFVESEDVQVLRNEDPIFKTYYFNVGARQCYPYEFIKVLRKTRDGFTGRSMIDENSLILAVAYNSLTFENHIVRKGGNKKGFLTSVKHLSDEAMKKIKEAWRELYANDKENVVVLNDGMDFKESSNTSVEMQLNENKITNSQELSMLFNVGNNIIRGQVTEQDVRNLVRFCIVPILSDIEASLNRDFLLEKEKKTKYWAFDTRALSRGDMKERYEAYAKAIDKNIMRVDEVRELEDLPAIGFDFIKLGLDSVLYNPKTNQIYTPNTNQTQDMNLKGGEIGNEN